MKRKFAALFCSLIAILGICFGFAACELPTLSPGGTGGGMTKPEESYKKVVFGQYPQTEVTAENDADNSIRNGLNEASGGVPTNSGAGGWKSYGYYIYGDVSNYMWYIDVDYEGNRYRGVYFASYRPYYTTNDSSAFNSNQDDNGYYTDKVYWFKYEPIEWRVLKESGGTALVLANVILDSQQYYHGHNSKMGSETIYPNNYKESDIRKWLNDTFLQTAFSASEMEKIQTTTVDNSAEDSVMSGSNIYACEDTEDKIFLLSYKEATWESVYGFTAASLDLKGTDYASSQGFSNEEWWLRTPTGDYSLNVSCVPKKSSYVYDTGIGVVPLMWIEI